MKAPLPEQATELARLDTQLTTAERAFTALDADLARAQQAWERSLAGAPIHWQPSMGLVAHYPLDGTLSAPIAVMKDGKQAPEAKVQNGEARFAPGRIGQAASFDGKSFIQGTDLKGFTLHGSYEDPYTMAAWIYSTAPTGAIVTKVPDSTEPSGHGLQPEGRQVRIQQRQQVGRRGHPHRDEEHPGSTNGTTSP